MSQQDSGVLIEQWIRPEIRQLKAYHVQNPTGMIKLDAMENPYAWPPEMQSAWIERVRCQSFNRYPDPTAQKLHTVLAQHLTLSEQQTLLFGNGSDELIQLIMMAMAQPDRVVMAPSPTFVMYDMIARFVGMRYQSVSLNPDFTLNLDTFLAEMHEHQPAVVFLAYPNNPTGNAFSRQQIETIIKQAPGLVVVDEAYNAFAEDSFIADTDRFANLVVMRTFSKVGLAGLRLGYLVGNQAWLSEFDKVRLPYNINVLTQLAVEFALDHYAVLASQADSIKAERELMVQKLTELSRIEVYPSQANFITLRLAAGEADRVFNALKTDGILIKNLSPAGGLLADCLRVTVGSPNENQAFLTSFCKHLLPSC